MPRKPAGTYTRAMPDWWYANTSTAGITPTKLEGDETSWCTCSLYNDAQQGSLLFLYAMDIMPAGDLCFTVHTFGVDGAPDNNSTSNGKVPPIYSGQPSQFGQLFSYTGAGEPPIASLANRSLGNFWGFVDQNPVSPANADIVPLIKLRQPGPLAVIKPGYAYTVVFIPNAGDVPSANFYWTTIEGI
jgi:hypothetical protein